jgi:L-fuconolactonase
VATGSARTWRDDLKRLAAHDNVRCKLSGLSTEAAPGQPSTELRPYIECGLEVFGAERCMVGTDWPVATLSTTAERWLDLVVDVIGELSSQEQAAVLSETATSTYDLVRPELHLEGEADARRAVRR